MLQSTTTLPHGGVNAGQYFSIKWKFPFSDDYSLFFRYGMGALLGISKKTDSEETISYGIGFKTKHLVDVGQNRQRTIETSWHAFIFYDRNNSLLASIVMRAVKEYCCMIDIHLEIIEFGGFSPGLWAVILRDENLMIGLTIKYI